MSDTGATLLREAILTRGRVDGTLLLVDDFLNHRVEPKLLDAIGRDLADHFRAIEPEIVLTAEASGLPPAFTTAHHLGIPMVYAKKFPKTGNRAAIHREVASPTKGVEYSVEVRPRALGHAARTIIIDDFLSGGRTAEALGEIVEESGGSVLGFGFAIEKSFAGGRSRLERRGWPITALVRVLSLDGGLRLADEL